MDLSSRLGPSVPVDSRQTGPHVRLSEMVRRHAAADYRKPPAAHNVLAFEVFLEVLAGHNGPCILDSGCGTGESTEVLAKRFPEALVVGIDKSATRLNKTVRRKREVSNPWFVRMDLVDFWLLAAKEKIRFERQYFLYPNPWPKPEHLQRRWPAHPIFPRILACGGILELRTNWDVYAREWAQAFRLLTGVDEPVRPWNPDQAISPHERKYQNSGHSLWIWSGTASLFPGDLS